MVVDSQGMKKLVLLPCLLAAACAMGAPDDEEVAQTQAELEAANGVSLNGVSLNGVSLNGVSLNGVSLNGVSLNGVSLNGVSLSGVSLNGTSLTGVKVSGGTVSGTGMVGATLTGTATNNASVTLMINNVYALGPPNTDVLAYVVTYQTTAGWKPLCANTNNEAIPLSGTWDMTTVRKTQDSHKMTLACRAATFAKCVELGYKPWASKNGTSLDDYHETCIRAIRADYCGDGKTYTVDGTAINIYDKLGVQVDTSPWKIEANWKTDGSVCIDTARYLTNLSHGAVPSCVADRADQTCSTSSWSPGVIMRTEANR
jgi:hypothetical protein